MGSSSYCIHFGTAKQGLASICLPLSPQASFCKIDWERPGWIERVCVTATFVPLWIAASICPVVIDQGFYQFSLDKKQFIQTWNYAEEHSNAYVNIVKGLKWQLYLPMEQIWTASFVCETLEVDPSKCGAHIAAMACKQHQHSEHLNYARCIPVTHFMKAYLAQANILIQFLQWSLRTKSFSICCRRKSMTQWCIIGAEEAKDPPVPEPSLIHKVLGFRLRGIWEGTRRNEKPEDLYSKECRESGAQNWTAGSGESSCTNSWPEQLAQVRVVAPTLDVLDVYHIWWRIVQKASQQDASVHW